MNVLCIVNQDHQRSSVVVDHSRNFKGIQSMKNPRLTGYNIENGGTLIQEKEEKIRKLKTKKLLKLVH